MAQHTPSLRLKAELITLFQRNPGIIDTPAGIARRIGRDEKEVEADLRSLCSIGVLGARRVGSSEIIFMERSKMKEVQDLGTYLAGLEMS